MRDLEKFMLATVAISAAGLDEDEDLIAQAIEIAWGERCPDYEPECWCCKAWEQYDRLKDRQS